MPIEHQVHLAEPVPLHERWLRHLLGLAKSDGAVICNDRLETCQFRARLKPTAAGLPPEQDDLGGGMRHQVTREFSAYAPQGPGHLRLPGRPYLPLPPGQTGGSAVLFSFEFLVFGIRFWFLNTPDPQAEVIKANKQPT